MSVSSVSTFVPEPNQARPLFANEGHALANTNTTMPAMSTSTVQATAPSRRSVRWSDQARTPEKGRRAAAGAGDASIYRRATQLVLMIARARLEVRIHRIHALAAPRAGPRVTIQKLRPPRYWPDLALRSVHGTPRYGIECRPPVKLNDA